MEHGWKVLVGAAGTLIVALLLVVAALGPIVRSTVNTVGPAILGVPVSLSDVTVRPLRGQMELGGLHIGNPPGFQADRLVEVGHLAVQARPAALLADPAVVDAVTIRGVRLTYETTGRRSNLGALSENLSRGSTSPPPAGGSADGGPRPGRRVVIRRMVMEDVRLKFAALRTGGRDVELPLDRIELTHLGGEQNPLTVASAISQVLAAITKGVGQAVTAGAGDLATAGLDVAETLGGLGLKGVSAAIEEGVRGAQAFGEDTASGVQAVTEGASRLMHRIQRILQRGEPPVGTAP